MHPQLFSPKPPGTARCAADCIPAAGAIPSFSTAARAGASRARPKSAKGSPRCTVSSTRLSAPLMRRPAGRTSCLCGTFRRIRHDDTWVRSGMRRTITPAPSLTSRTISADSTTGYRHGNALSYAVSTGPVSFQMDLISDGEHGYRTGDRQDRVRRDSQSLGEIGKVALAHTTVRDEMVKKMVIAIATEHPDLLRSRPRTESTSTDEASTSTFTQRLQ